MDRTRFGRWVVLACIGAVAACSTQESDGDVRSELFAVVNGTGDIMEVMACVQCDGVDETIFGTVVANDAEFCTPLAFVSENLWHTFMDVAGFCTITLSANSVPEGEPLCYSMGTVTVPLGGMATLQMDLNCNVAADGSGGTLDLHATQVNTVDNICLQYYSLEINKSDIPLPPVGDPAETMVYVRANDPDDHCGTDPLNTNPGVGGISTCDVSPDPKRITITCVANLLTNGNGSLGAVTGSWRDPVNSGAGHDGDSDPRTFNGEDDSNGIFTCNTPGPFRITCGGNEGDFDCTKTKTHDGICPGVNLCETPDPDTCIDQDSDDCQVPGDCAPLTGLCPEENLPTDTTCFVTQNATSVMGSCQGADCGGQGADCTCELPAGACFDEGRGDDVPPNATDCPQPTDDCRVATCINGQCGFDTGNVGELCSPNESDVANSSGTCDADGDCLCTAGDPANCDCINDGQCPGTQACAVEACDVAGGSCSGQPDVAGDCTVCATDSACFGGDCTDVGGDGQCLTCTGANDIAGICRANVCDEAVVFTNAFDLGSASEFRAYSGLLRSEGEEGAPPAGACSTPDLSGPPAGTFPGSTIAGFESQCIVAVAPDVSGQLTFTPDNGDWVITGNVALEFTIDAIIDELSAQAFIQTSSDTPMDGTGMGMLADGQHIVADPIPNDFQLPGTNMNVGIECFCEADRDPDGEVLTYTPCGTNNNNGPGNAPGTCPVDDQLCIKSSANFVGGCFTGTVFCAGFGLVGAGTPLQTAPPWPDADACTCFADETNPLGLCVKGGEDCDSCGAGFPCTCAPGAPCPECPGVAFGQQCDANNECTPLSDGSQCWIAGGNPCAVSTDCPYNNVGQTCNFDPNDTITDFTCNPMFGPPAVGVGFCGNPGQTCTRTTANDPTTGVCDPIGQGSTLCPQEFGQTCVSNLCMPVDGSAIVCELANGLKPGLQPTPLPGDPLLRQWGELLFSFDNNTCGLNLVMDRDDDGGGRTVPGGWYINNPPFLRGNGTQFLGIDAVQVEQ